MNFKNRLSSAHVRHIDVNLTVESAGTHKSRIENIRAVRRRDYDYAVVRLETVHLNEKLVKGLFSFVVASAETCASLATYRVDFVDEHYARHALFSHCEKVSHPACAHADEHFNEVRSAYGKERNVSLSRNRLCEQRFTCSRRAYEKHALRNSRAEKSKFFGVFQEFYNLLQLFLFFFRAGDVGKSNLNVLVYAGFCFAEIHRAFVRAVDRTHKKHNREKPHAKHKGGHDKARPERPRVGIRAVDNHAVFLQKFDFFGEERLRIKARFINGFPVLRRIVTGKVVNVDDDFLNRRFLRVIDDDFLIAFHDAAVGYGFAVGGFIFYSGKFEELRRRNAFRSSCEQAAEGKKPECDGDYNDNDYRRSC